MKKYNKVAVGGTFDRLHTGHRELLNKAFSISSKVVIGITSKSMIENKTLSLIIEPFSTRQANVVDYLKQKGFQKRATIVPLYDEFGPSLSDLSIEAVVIGPRVLEKPINTIKKHKDVILCKTIESTDGSHLSSTRIRKGQVTRNGRVYKIPSTNLCLPKNMRNALRKPFGNYTKNPKTLIHNNTSMTISVGDASFIKLKTSGVYPDIAILDGMIRRKRVFAEDKIRQLAGKKYDFSRTENLAGTLSKRMMKVVKKAIDTYLKTNKKQLVYVRGEDDLTVLATIYFSPLTSILFYGQPAFPSLSIKPGLIAVHVNEQKKKYVNKLINKFKPC